MLEEADDYYFLPLFGKFSQENAFVEKSQGKREWGLSFFYRVH